ncbi:MAG TPA: peptide chain release factor 2 [Candidatus Saccharimonadia bacterium]|jgi:peptide chain release factor 2
MQELLKKFETLSTKISGAVRQLRIDQAEAEAETLTNETLRPDFWNQPGEAASKSQQLAGLVKHVETWRGLEKEVADEIEALREFGTDPGYLESAATTYERLAAEFSGKEFELMLSGPHDRASAIVEIHAGTGGTDAQDWASMLERMYLRWAERQSFTTEVLSESPGEEAGIKSVTFEVNGPYAYGKLKSEAGVHRLVRLSPFNSDNLRQTSFALVEVLPQIEQQAELEISPEDLRIDVYRSGGHGGQSVNTTDSAVRITHLPTGIVVAIQNERSQLQNREKAMAVLKSRLTALMEAEHKKSLTDLRASDKSAEWGSQIRNYVLHPYTKVKDVRTGAETSDAQSVLDGDLDLFIDAYLLSNIAAPD